MKTHREYIEILGIFSILVDVSVIDWDLFFDSVSRIEQQLALPAAR
jgi:hypothetical protein